LASVRVTKVDGTSNVLDSANDVIKNLVSHMDVDVVVNLKEADNEETGGPVFEIEGDDSGLLIGRKGETLRSLQFLTRFIVGRQTGERANISLDVEGYDERRKQSLANLANRVAQRVVKTGRSIELEPMSARERRLVHVALAENSEVYTESSGEGRDRRVVVIPS
tara:strand:+ start:644 stop:1138 length:495 start_codon:yes stop_codon:yes gene_type:complete